MVYLFLADGFEETEALVTADILRRAGLSLQTVGIGGKTVTGAHGIAVGTDTATFSIENAEAVILPGGMPGTRNLEASPIVQQTIRQAMDRGLLIAAICAAPSVLGHAGLLIGKKATCFPGYEADLHGATVCADSVVRDGNVITGKGAGVTMDFAFEIVKTLVSPEKAKSVKEAMQCK